MMLVCYCGIDEVLVTTIENEEEFLDEWFTNGGREYADYDRTECPKVAQILSHPQVWGN
jgi:hypothetical protein